MTATERSSVAVQPSAEDGTGSPLGDQGVAAPPSIETAERLAETLPGAVLTHMAAFAETVIFVRTERIQDVCLTLRDELGFEHLSGVTAVDRLPYGEEPRFYVVYHLLCRDRRERLRLKAPVIEGQTIVPSVTGIYPTADWFER